MSSTTPRIDAQGFKDLVTFLGMNISGDVGGYTVYTTRKGKIVWYPASPAEKPPSPLQKKQRLRFRMAQENYMALTAAAQAAWEALTKVLSLPLTGQNLFISLSLNPNDTDLSSALAKANISLPPPPVVPD